MSVIFDMYMVTSMHDRAVMYVNQIDSTRWLQKYVHFVLV